MHLGRILVARGEYKVYPQISGTSFRYLNFHYTLTLTSRFDRSKTLKHPPSPSSPPSNTRIAIMMSTPRASGWVLTPFFLIILAATALVVYSSATFFEGYIYYNNDNDISFSGTNGDDYAQSDDKSALL